MALRGEFGMGELHQLIASEAFCLQAAGRLASTIFAPWVQDLALLVGSVEAVRPADALPDWQPGAVMRMPFSKKICHAGQDRLQPGAHGVRRQRDGCRLLGRMRLFIPATSF
jgi:hypothetical protein